MKNLDVTFDPKLTFVNHVNGKVLEAYRTLTYNIVRNFKAEGFSPERSYDSNILLRTFGFNGFQIKRQRTSIAFSHNLARNNIDCPQFTGQLNFNALRYNSRHVTFSLKRTRTNIRLPLTYDLNI